MLSVTVLCSDLQHPIYPYLRRWADSHAAEAAIQIIQRSADAAGGDLLLLVSCHEIIKSPVRSRYRHTLVIHASDLPSGKGMSPHVWQILEGRSDITVTLLDAADALDAGDIWHQQLMQVPATALHDEIHHLLFETELQLMSWALAHHAGVQPRRQTGEGSFYRKRTPDDSRIALDSTLGEAFNQLRIADPQRYPAFIEVGGQRFKIMIERM
jgi:methionyl-tRNA formyltransferase